MTTKDFLIVDLDNSNSLRYSKFVKGKIGYHDNIRISLDGSNGKSYILDKANYYVVFDDFIDIIAKYKKGEVFTFEINEVASFERGLGYYQSLNFNQINDKNTDTKNILERLDKTESFLFGRMSVSDIMTNCFSFQNNFYIELSKRYMDDAPDSEQEYKNFANWLDNKYQLLYRIKLSLDQLNVLESTLQQEFDKLIK